MKQYTNVYRVRYALKKNGEFLDEPVRLIAPDFETAFGIAYRIRNEVRHKSAVEKECFVVDIALEHGDVIVVTEEGS